MYLYSGQSSNTFSGLRPQSVKGVQYTPAFCPLSLHIFTKEASCCSVKLFQPESSPTYTVPAGLTKEEMREVIRNERRVELAFEEHRFFDIRRWRLLDDPQEKADYLKIEGMQIVKDDNDEPHYSKYTVENRVFDERMYLYPIPKSEILKAPGITQNPGW